MKSQEPPQVLRVKRKRTDDPLQALVMETGRRQIKRPRYVFRLKRTEERDIEDSTAVLTASESRENNKPVFKIPSTRKSKGVGNGGEWSAGDKASREPGSAHPEPAPAPVELNPELLEMLNDYLKDNDETTITNPVKPPKRRQSSLSQELNSRPLFSKEKILTEANNQAIDEADELTIGDDSEYVYDVYYRDKAISAQWETEHIGYIRFDDEDTERLENDNDDFAMNTDDEDSNDENFYRNDYPEDEDSGYDDQSELGSMGLDEPSDDQDDEFQILNDKRRFSRTDFMRSEGLKSMSDDEYHNLADNIDETPALWGTNVPDEEIRDESGMDMDSDASHDFERHEFFKSDAYDPIAIHRDQIFGKLQRMIDRESE